MNERKRERSLKGVYKNHSIPKIVSASRLALLGALP